MSIASFFVSRMYKLPKARNRVIRHRNVDITMPDGVVLAGEHYAPAVTDRRPTLLLRHPYGLRSFGALAEVYAERGFHVIQQACRGTDRSGGDFDPLRHERDDGLATLEWIKAQDWFDGRLGVTGPSYLGYAQWAISDALPKHSAMSTKVTSAEFRSVVFPGGAFHLGLWLGWLQTIEGIRKSPAKFARSMASGAIEKKTAEAAARLPLIDADVLVTGHQVGFWRDWFENAIGNDAFWEPLDHTHRLGLRTPPNHFISGWYDFMLDQLLRDYETLVEAGHTPYLTVGPWTHVSNDLHGESIRQTLTWMHAHLEGKRAGLRHHPVRIYISGEERWREFDAYPPGPPTDQIWHVSANGVFSQRAAHVTPPDTYRYDPADPTPSLGGAMFAFSGAGPVDNAPLEARGDVLVYTSEPLVAPITVIGQPRMTLHARASLLYADYFVRLCDVSPDGKSTNICDGFIRVSPADPAMPDNIWKLKIRLHATAHQFGRGHRLRLLIASGAHPRYARNTGTGEPLGLATTLEVADMEIFHDPAHPSAIILPVYEFGD